jgi:hypothetical protein
MKNLFLISLVTFLSGSFRDAPFTNLASGIDEISVDSPSGGAFLTFAGKFGGEVTKKDIESNRELGVDGCARGSKIFTYTLDVNKGGRIQTFQASSNVLSSEMHSKLKSLTAGDSFEFRQIKAYLPNGKDVVDVHAKKFIVG